jgi:hypothetical protein
MSFECPIAAIYFNHNPNKLIVACHTDIFIVDLSTQSTQPFSSTSQGAWYRSHAFVLSYDDAMLVAGNSNYPYNVCGYDTASLARLWIHNTAHRVGAVCMLGAHVLVTVDYKPSLILECKTGKLIATLPKANGCIFGSGLIEGSCFILSFLSHSHRPPYIRASRHASTPPLQASQVVESASGDVGLDREVPRVAATGCCDAHHPN